jgi:hypothetical protein
MCLCLNRLVDPANSLVLQRHRVFYSENLFFCLGAHAVLDQLLHAASSRDKGIHQIAVERIGYSAQALQGDAIFSLSLFQLQRELAARPQPTRDFTRRDAQRLSDRVYPSLRWARDFPRRLVWLQAAIQLIQPKIPELFAHDGIF